MDKANFFHGKNASIKLYRRFEIRAHGFARIRFAPGEIGLAGSVYNGVRRDRFERLGREIVNIVWPNLEIEIGQVPRECRANLAAAEKKNFFQA